jgi:hypothetical protein
VEIGHISVFLSLISMDPIFPSKIFVRNELLSQALLMVLPEGFQVNQELRILGLVLPIYTPLIQVRSGM